MAEGISAIIFDVDGTLYNETDVKATAELETAVYLAGRSGVTAEKIYTVFTGSYGSHSGTEPCHSGANS